MSKYFPETCIMTLIKKIIRKVANLKLVILLEYQNIETIFAKEYVRNLSAEVFHIAKVKNTVSWTYVISYLKDEEIVEIF